MFFADTVWNQGLDLSTRQPNKQSKGKIITWFTPFLSEMLNDPEQRFKLKVLEQVSSKAVTAEGGSVTAGKHSPHTCRTVPGHQAIQQIDEKRVAGPAHHLRGAADQGE